MNKSQFVLEKKGLSKSDNPHFENDRIVHAWLQFSGRYDRKTISTKNWFIRELEVLLRASHLRRKTGRRLGFPRVFKRER